LHTKLQQAATFFDRVTIPHRPVHDDDCRAIVDADDATGQVVVPDDILSQQPERIFCQLSDDAKLRRVRAVTVALLGR
jgi:hypothetical protein